MSREPLGSAVSDVAAPDYEKLAARFLAPPDLPILREPEKAQSLLAVWRDLLSMLSGLPDWEIKALHLVRVVAERRNVSPLSLRANGWASRPTLKITINTHILDFDPAAIHPEHVPGIRLLLLHEAGHIIQDQPSRPHGPAFYRACRLLARATGLPSPIRPDTGRGARYDGTLSGIIFHTAHPKRWPRLHRVLPPHRTNEMPPPRRPACLLGRGRGGSGPGRVAPEPARKHTPMVCSRMRARIVALFRRVPASGGTVIPKPAKSSPAPQTTQTA